MKYKARSAGGIATGIIVRKKAIEGYYENPKYCEQCDKLMMIKETDKVKDIKKRKYCSDKCEKESQESDLKKKIIKLFYDGKKFREIASELKCAKSTVSYYCSELIPEDERYSRENILKYQKYYDTYGNNLAKTAKFFGLNKGTLRLKIIAVPFKNVSPEQKVTNLKKAVCDYRRKNKIKAVAYKGGKCQNCGYKKSVYCLDFHHVNPEEKDFAIASVTRRWEIIKRELDKCILVCRNCHGEIHEEIHVKGFSGIVNKIQAKAQVAELV